MSTGTGSASGTELRVVTRPDGMRSPCPCPGTAKRSHTAPVALYRRCTSCCAQGVIVRSFAPRYNASGVFELRYRLAPPFASASFVSVATALPCNTQSAAVWERSPARERSFGVHRPHHAGPHCGGLIHIRLECVERRVCLCRHLRLEVPLVLRGQEDGSARARGPAC